MNKTTLIYHLELTGGSRNYETDFQDTKLISIDLEEVDKVARTLLDSQDAYLNIYVWNNNKLLLQRQIECGYKETTYKEFDKFMQNVNKQINYNILVDFLKEHGFNRGFKSVESYTIEQILVTIDFFGC